MGAARELIEETGLSNWVSLNSLDSESFNKLVSLSTINRLPPGRHLFDIGDIDNTTIYLLSGQLALISDGKPAITIKAGTGHALNPIAHQQPRTATALARTCVTILTIETALLNKYFCQNTLVKITCDNDRDLRKERINQAMEISLISQLPLPYKHVLSQRFEEIQVNMGDVIIQEGNDSKYYYLLSQGRCCITTKTGHPGITPEYTEFAAGYGFDEESLITSSLHRYSVTMLEDGKLLVLSRGEFITLIVRPLINALSYQQLKKLGQDITTLIDLRTPIVFRKSHLTGSINLPFSLFKNMIPILDKNREYIICGDRPDRNIVAAFLLLKNGFKTRILNQGVRKILGSLA